MRLGVAFKIFYLPCLRIFIQNNQNNEYDYPTQSFAYNNFKRNLCMYL